MDDLTRRGFVRSSAGAAAGIATIGALDVGEAEAKGHPKKKHHHKKHAHHSNQHSVVAWISDPHNGKITVMRGNREVTIRDHKLARQLARHVR